MKNLKITIFLWLCCALTQTVFGQTITGVVTSSDDNAPLPGVTVFIKGVSIGTTTDIEGKYSLQVDSLLNIENIKLVFSYIGFVSQEVEVNTQKVINIKLSADNMSLSEVVITGYSVSKKGKKWRKKSKKGNDLAYSNEIQYPNESYAQIEENGFLKVAKKPLSTFSVDVDGASYSNVRRYLNGGTMPPKDAIRIEEMINYFDYKYNIPDGETPFSINSELSYCPWNEKNLLLHIGLKGKEISMENLPPSNIVFLLDVSGSMSDQNKLPLLKSSLKLLLETLREEDRVAIVVYAGSSGLILPSTSCKKKNKILSALNRLNAGGSTAGGAGLKLAYKIANQHFIKGGNNRIILATDGDFNVGVQSNEALKQLVEKERENGVAISVLGFGMGNYKDDKMELIANNGNGNYAYIDNILEAKKVLVNEFGGTFYTIAKDVKFQLEFNPEHVSEYRLIGYENRLLEDEDFEDDKKDAGEIGTGHTVTALYEIVTSSNKKNKSVLKYQEQKLTTEALESNDLITLKLRYKLPKKSKSTLVESVVKNTPLDIEKTTDNFRFSASVAVFGMLLKSSKYAKKATWDLAYELGKSARGKDTEGYRAEYLRLVESAELLMVGQDLSER